MQVEIGVLTRQNPSEVRGDVDNNINCDKEPAATGGGISSGGTTGITSSPDERSLQVKYLFDQVHISKPPEQTHSGRFMNGIG